MNDELLKDYAEYLLTSHADDIENLSIWEMEDSFRLQWGAAFEGENGELSEAEFGRVRDLLNTAVVTIQWGPISCDCS